MVPNNKRNKLKSKGRRTPKAPPPVRPWTTSAGPTLPISLRREQWEAIYVALHSITDPRAARYREGLRTVLTEFKSVNITIARTHEVWATLNNWLVDLPGEIDAFRASHSIVEQMTIV